MVQTTSTQIGPDAVAHPSVNGHPTGNEDSLLFHDLPSFPEDLQTAPLLRLNLKKLVENDSDEIERLWRACCDVGFFYLDLRDVGENKRDSAYEAATESQINGEGLLQDADALFKLAPEVFALPVEEKDRYDYKDKGSYFGYKGMGKGIIDATGTKDRNEFWNVSKDDILGISAQLENPAILTKEANRELFRSYIVRSHAVIDLLLKHLNDKLELPAKTLQDLHRLRGVSGDQVRWVRSPPQAMDDRQKSLGEHTDFGSMTVLFNRLGGLQIQMPETNEWRYVKPLQGHCICNLGDAMVKFSAGILRSNMHRVVNPPGGQGDSTRLSLVYFSRPLDDAVLNVLEGSDMIDAERKKRPEYQSNETVTAKEWILRRAMGRREGGDWKATLGTDAGRVSS